MIYPRPVLVPRRIVPLALTTCLLAGCAISPATVSRAVANTKNQDSPISFEYIADGGDDYIDQVVEMDNDTADAVIPTLAFTPLGTNGTPLPDVKVVTAFGSDKGNVVVPQGGAWDILEFTGQGRDEVTDVKITVVKSEQTYYPYVEDELYTQGLDASGDEDEYFENFRSVRIANTNDLPLAVRLAYVVWDADEAGPQQQFQVSVPIGGLVTVPAGGDTKVDVDAAALAAISRNGGESPASVLAYYSR